MLSRLLPKPSHLRSLTPISSKLSSHLLQPQNPNPTSIFTPRFFSSSSNDNNNNGKYQSDTSVWKLSQESDRNCDRFFGGDSADPTGGGTVETGAAGEADSWLKEGNSGDRWETAEGYKPWSLVEEEKDDVFDIGEDLRNVGEIETEVSALDIDTENDRNQELETEEQQLSVVLKG